jgi:hypothetical protein
MNTRTHNQNQVKLFSKDMLTILLREELKSRKLASILHDLGVEEQCPWLPCLNDPIAECLGIQTDAFQEYDMLMDLFAQHTSTIEDIASTARRIADELNKTN